jgi:uncharacterized phage-associated protein
MTTPILDKEKTLNAALYVANKLQRKDIHKISKILYFADRDHLNKYGRTITGDTYIAMEYGPVPSYFYDIVKAIRENNSCFIDLEKGKELFDVTGEMVTPKKQADMDYLSESDIEELDNSLKKYSASSFNTMTKKSHSYAWKKTSANAEMSIEDIMKETGADDDFIKYITEDIAIQKSLQ